MVTTGNLIMNILDIDYLRECLKYNSESGVLTWKVRPSNHFSAGKGSNSRYAGESTGWLGRDGYVRISINGKQYPAHRLAYAIYYGEFPEGQIDHINHNRTDNCIANLRMVSHQENLRNQTMRNDNTSGITGVSWHKRDNKWRAQICIDSCQKSLGYFTHIFEAACSRKSAENKYGFHKNHGAKR